MNVRAVGEWELGMAGIHAGQTIYIVAPGVSLTLYPPEDFGGVPCIYLNTALHYAWPHMQEAIGGNVYWMLAETGALEEYIAPGTRWWQKVDQAPPVDAWLISSVYRHVRTLENGEAFLAFMNPATWHLYNWRRVEQGVPDVAEGELWIPTLFGAIALAHLMGAAEVRMVGVDYGPLSGRTHWDLKKAIENCKRHGYQQREEINRFVVPACKEMGIRLRRWSSPDVEVGICSKRERPGITWLEEQCRSR